MFKHPIQQLWLNQWCEFGVGPFFEDQNYLAFSFADISGTEISHFSFKKQICT